MPHREPPMPHREPPIDLYFRYSDDTPRGKDPDGFSETLNKHHRKVWSKPLPSGSRFTLEKDTKNGKLLLKHTTGAKEFILASDAIFHPFFWLDENAPSKLSDRVSYSRHFPHKQIREVCEEEIKALCNEDRGIACYMVFPGLKSGGQTINQARGVSAKIRDRFDLTLECIRRFYEKSPDINPLHSTLERYKDFFELFVDFRGYMEFFHLQGLVDEPSRQVRFWTRFDNFNSPALPQTPAEYLAYKNGLLEFINERRHRIKAELESRLEPVVQ